MSKKHNGSAAGYYIEFEKGSWRETKDPVFVSGMGLEGDRHYGDESSQVCLMDEEVRRWIDADPERGFCFKKIRENVLVKGVDFESLNEGDEISLAGTETVLVITMAGKHCFPDKCGIAKNKEKCLLRKGVAFATVK